MEEAGERSKVELHRVRGAENSLRVGTEGSKTSGKLELRAEGIEKQMGVQRRKLK